ncbi:hypothetical protein T492DRAFT_897679, partial [Pavlovales sp. CCMP2436]
MDGTEGAVRAAFVPAVTRWHLDALAERAAELAAGAPLAAALARAAGARAAAGGSEAGGEADGGPSAAAAAAATVRAEAEAAALLGSLLHIDSISGCLDALVAVPARVRGLALFEADAVGDDDASAALTLAVTLVRLARVGSARCALRALTLLRRLLLCAGGRAGESASGAAAVPGERVCAALLRGLGSLLVAQAEGALCAPAAVGDEADGPLCAALRVLRAENAAAFSLPAACAAGRVVASEAVALCRALLHAEAWHAPMAAALLRALAGAPKTGEAAGDELAAEPSADPTSRGAADALAAAAMLGGYAEPLRHGGRVLVAGALGTVEALVCCASAPPLLLPARDGGDDGADDDEGDVAWDEYDYPPEPREAAASAEAEAAAAAAHGMPARARVPALNATTLSAAALAARPAPALPVAPTALRALPATLGAACILRLARLAVSPPRSRGSALAIAAARALRALLATQPPATLADLVAGAEGAEWGGGRGRAALAALLEAAAASGGVGATAVHRELGVRAVEGTLGALHEAAATGWARALGVALLARAQALGKDAGGETGFDKQLGFSRSACERVLWATPGFEAAAEALFEGEFADAERDHADADDDADAVADADAAAAGGAVGGAADGTAAAADVSEMPSASGSAAGSAASSNTPPRPLGGSGSAAALPHSPSWATATELASALGFSARLCRHALRRAGGDANIAATWLLAVDPDEISILEAEVHGVGGDGSDSDSGESGGPVGGGDGVASGAAPGDPDFAPRAQRPFSSADFADESEASNLLSLWEPASNGSGARGGHGSAHGADAWAAPTPDRRSGARDATPPR